MLGKRKRVETIRPYRDDEAEDELTSGFYLIQHTVQVAIERILTRIRLAARPPSIWKRRLLRH